MIDRHAWERPGAFAAGPGIYRISLPLPGDHLKAVNVYAIVDGDRLVLVDGGWAMGDSVVLLEQSLGALGFGLRDIGEFLVTHVHRDHYTQAVAIRRRTGARVSLGEGEQASLEAIHTLRTHPDVANLIAAGAARLASRLTDWPPEERDLTDWELPDRWLPDRIELPLVTRTLHVIATPGHTRGHVVFHDPSANTLFAGDHVLPHITPSIGVELQRPASPLRDYLASLELVRALPDATLLPAHGPSGGSLHERVDELLAHHAQRLRATAEVVGRGAATGFEAAGLLTWTRHERSFDELDPYNQVLAVHETMAHLRVLVERGRLAEHTADGVRVFTLS